MSDQMPEPPLVVSGEPQAVPAPVTDTGGEPLTIELPPPPRRDT